MAGKDWLAKRFDASRDHLRAVAYRTLGWASEAEDAVQETWLKLSRSDSREVENLGGWLTTVIARVCLDMLRANQQQPGDRCRARRCGRSGPAGGTGDAGAGRTCRVRVARHI